MRAGVGALVVAVFVCGITPVWAVDCLQFKKIPGVFLNTPDWTKSVVQPRVPMNLLHGNVVATLVDNYQINADVNPVDGGFCVGLKSVSASVGYNDFVVNIDIRHVPGSCEYNAVLAHEDKHIKAYLSVMDDFRADVQKSVYSAAQSIMPRFVKSRDDVGAVVEMMNNELQAHPDLVLVKQKIGAAQEIRNKQIDKVESGADLKSCK